MNKNHKCVYCEKQIKTKKSLTKDSFGGYAHSRCHKAKKYKYDGVYQACA
jgi:hypothetical protein